MPYSEFRQSRLIALDLLRFLSLLSVIAIHSFDTSQVLHTIAFKLEAWAVPEFLLISFFLTAKKLDKTDFVVSRIKRLIIPYLAFSILYLSTIIAKIYILKHLFDWSLLSHILTIFLFGGACGHLYYIPMYLLYLIIIHLLCNAKSNFQFNKINSMFYLTLFSFFGSLFSSYVINPLLQVRLSDPYITSFIRYFSNYLPYPFIGVFISYSIQNNLLKLQLSQTHLYYKLFLLVSIAVIYIFQLEYAPVIRIFLSVSIFLLFLSLNQKLLNYNNIKFFSVVASLSIGVYLLHPLLIETTQLLLNKVFNLEVNSFILTFMVWLFAGVIISHLLVFYYQKLIK